VNKALNVIWFYGHSRLILRTFRSVIFDKGWRNLEGNSVRYQTMGQIDKKGKTLLSTGKNEIWEATVTVSGIS